MEIDYKLAEIIRVTFEDEALEVTADTSADDIEAWDSVAHISLIFAIEEEFGFQFTSGELESMRNVGDLQNVITGKTG
ncbi:MAG: acyl carrier protein [Pirellulaceae bacterium]